MSLTTSIQNIVTTKYPDAKYHLSSNFNINKLSYKIEDITTDAPIIVLNNEIQKNKEVQLNYNVLSDTTIKMLFLTKVEEGVYATDVAINSDIEEMEQKADEVALQIIRLSQIRAKTGEIFKYKITPVFKAYSSILSGVILEIKVKENQIINICPS